MEEVYLDNAATTPISSAVLAELTDRYQHVFGNASTLYGLGRAANQVLEQARHTMQLVFMPMTRRLFSLVVELKVTIPQLSKLPKLAKRWEII